MGVQVGKGAAIVGQGAGQAQKHESRHKGGIRCWPARESGWEQFAQLHRQHHVAFSAQLAA